MNKSRAAGLIILMGGIGTAVWAYHQGQVQQEAVLGRIVALNARLAANNLQAAKANAATVRLIGRAVYYNRFPARDVAVLRMSQLITARCASLTDTLRTWQRELRTGAGEDAVGPLRHAIASTALPATKRANLARSLNAYSSFVRAFVPEAVALAPPILPSGPGFTWLNPDGAPLAAALASLMQLETQIRRLAAAALRHEAEKVGSECICFDKIGPVAAATANSVAQGAVYEARLFLSQSTPAYHTEMSADGHRLQVDRRGEGLVEFRVPALRPSQPDTMQGQWQGVIRTQTYLADTTLWLNVPYYIIKPRS